MWIGQVDGTQHPPAGPNSRTFTHSGFATLKRQIDRVSTDGATIDACLQALVVPRPSE